MFKQRLQGLVAGVLIGVLLTGGVVFADNISKTVDVIYNSIKIFIDGAEYVAKDANGNVIEPFIYNGTTYLPVRGIANAFGKDVIWDGENASVYLGKTGQNQPDDYLHKLQYNDCIRADGYNFWVLNGIGSITDFSKSTYTNGLIFNDSYANFRKSAVENEIDQANVIMDYPINGQYTSIAGTVVLPQKIDVANFNKDNENARQNTADVFIYGDGRLLKKISQASTTMPMKFEASIKGVNMLTLKIKTYNDYTVIALTDLALYK